MSDETRPDATADINTETFGPMKETLDSVLEERGKRYGNFRDHAHITWQIKGAIHAAVLRRDPETFASDHLEALDMIAHKIGRIVNGDPNYADSWVDIAGYAQLVADRLNGVVR